MRLCLTGADCKMPQLRISADSPAMEKNRGPDTVDTYRVRTSEMPHKNAGRPLLIKKLLPGAWQL